MKRDRRKIVGVVVYDYQMAQIADRAGVDIVSVGDSVGTVLWGQPSDADITLDEMRLACRAVCRGVARALVSCDVPTRVMQEGPAGALNAAARLVREDGAALVKIDAADEWVGAVRAIVAANIPVWAQFRGQTASGGQPTVDELVSRARTLEAAGASLIDFTHSGPDAGAAVAAAVSIPVLGGLGGGPWLDGRIRSTAAAIGYVASALEDDTPRYANVARSAFDAITVYADDVRTGRQVRGK